ncbi:ABC transporter ATP-binding protein [Insolitispirillum peregrinum]|uniref:ATP-binding cassette, subfamily B n=1 Tax=Insolitispirillum peregrinum TaxID=80876 RepID=A0A1N7QBQ4_9PROT|nr:ABC transporter ATP-binding protein [Insolitispirillum peregrinum]SIT20300.1 ATP-binding cassette, subfamily B [Insolitispirillum peregrinum]
MDGTDSDQLRQHRRWMVAWVAGFLPPRLRRLAVVLALSLLATAAGLVQPMLTKALIDQALPDRRMDLVILLCGGLFAMSVFSLLLGYGTRLLYVRVSGDLLFSLRESLFRHLMSLSPRWFARAREGDLFSRLDGDITEVQRFTLDGALAAINATFALIGAVIAMISLSVPLTLMCLAVLPLQMALVARFRPRIEQQTRQVRQRAADLGAFFFDTLPAAKVIQAHSAQERESDRLHRLNGLYLDELLRQERLGFFAGAGPSLIMSAATALIFVFGAASVLGQSLTIGAMVAFTSYLGRAAAPLQSYLGLWVASRRALVSLDRLAELRLVPPEVCSPASPQPLPDPLRGAVSLRQVMLGHDRQRPLLRDLSLEIAAGSKVALIGPSGCGKSTLCDLLLRLYDPDQGEVCLDGVPLPRLDLLALRQVVAVVAQDVVLLPGSLADNIAYGVAHPTREAIEQAAETAGLAEVIAALPHGLDSPVGSHGRLLSGGQRQRVALARAVLQRPRVLILDEVTTGLDPALRDAVLATLDRQFADCTRIIVSHDPQVMAGCDQVVDLEHCAKSGNRFSQQQCGNVRYEISGRHS